MFLLLMGGKDTVGEISKRSEAKFCLRRHRAFEAEQTRT